MYKATCSVLQLIIKDGKRTQRGEADKAYDDMTSFEFVVVLHTMVELLEMTDDLCQALQRKSQDILNAMDLVSKTKILIQSFREGGWDPLLENIKAFCENHKIELLDMEAHYTSVRGRFRQPKDRVTNGHYYRVDVFTATVDSQLHELNHRFNDDMIELLALSSSLDPKGNFQRFSNENICKLVKDFYPNNFTDRERIHLKYQLQLLELEKDDHLELQNLHSISEFCQWLAKSRKATMFYLLDKMIRLILTILVSTATAKRAFSYMKFIKTTLRNSMADDYLTNCLIVYTEKEIARKFDLDSIIDEFAVMKERRSLFKI